VKNTKKQYKIINDLGAFPFDRKRSLLRKIFASKYLKNYIN